MTSTMASHSPLLIVLMVVNIVAFLLNQAVGFLSMVDLEAFAEFNRIFGKSLSELSDERYVEITPSSSTFSIWGGIYVWQAIWMIYALVNICRRAPDGPVYTSPVLLTPAFFAVSIFNWMCVITWTFVWKWDHLWVSFVFLALVFISIYTCIGLSYKALAQHMNTLIKQERKYEIWMIRGFVQNGLAFYGAWCTIATLLNLASALSYDQYPKLDQSTACTVCLSILALELVVFAVSDWTVMDKYSRYTFSPYVVVIVALSGSIVKNWNPMKTNSIFTAVLLGISTVCLIVKMLLMFFRHCRDSKKQEEILPTTKEHKDMRM